MLTVVDNLSGSWMLIRGCAASKVWSPFKQCDLQPESARAQAAAKPARPPPTTATLGVCVHGLVMPDA